MLIPQLPFLALKFFVMIPPAVLTDPSENITGLQYLFNHLSSSEAELDLPPRQFLLNATSDADREPMDVFELNLTNGKLRTSRRHGPQRSQEGCKYIRDDAVSCYISTLGWHATYNGTIKNTEQKSDIFVVTVFVKKYNLPFYPADIWIYMKFGDTSSSRYTSSTPSDFMLDVTSDPIFECLDMFKGKKTLSNNAWDKLKKKTSWRIKLDLIDAMMTKYKLWIETEIQY